MLARGGNSRDQLRHTSRRNGATERRSCGSAAEHSLRAHVSQAHGGKKQKKKGRNGNFTRAGWAVLENMMQTQRKINKMGVESDHEGGERIRMGKRKKRVPDGLGINSG